MVPIPPPESEMLEMTWGQALAWTVVAFVVGLLLAAALIAASLIVVLVYLGR